jgi:hypothetical protein
LPRAADRPSGDGPHAVSGNGFPAGRRWDGLDRYRRKVQEEPIDPFAGDPADPAMPLGGGDDENDPLSADERQDVLEDLADLAIYQALLTPLGVRGLVIECEDCHEPHYFDWDLLRGNLRHLLDSGRPRVHEPAYNPDPDHYVTWEYARGYADGIHDALADPSDDPDDLQDAVDGLGTDTGDTADAVDEDGEAAEIDADATAPESGRDDGGTPDGKPA